MIALELSVPVACWRKGRARELVETEVLPPPATCYGALLSLVGEQDRERHRGCRVTAGVLNAPVISTVLRTFWRSKNLKVAKGNDENAAPDQQQLVIEARLVVWCDSGEEVDSRESLEVRVIRAMLEPGTVTRSGAWSLGESTHLINDAHLLPAGRPPASCRTFLVAPAGALTLPVWVDHVGTRGSRYAVGLLEDVLEAPAVQRLPRIPLAEGAG
ncbi:type I-MYXAN CRISPR-associated protein Cas5/Cmx5/DevS [Corallococcus macrosporus]|uniref:Type I-MYXAN CRISPR-associated protein Cas5/Cmx5/DevS n=1 Tax=Corallococcus macrosporus DSM 14697 TaxID=1189310 RepID=A0A286NVX3_9BACT|nr:type I-MYXAN CRISPR-associated protein Cas5/Cmx5/DevS [Corallococcus macrosporus]ATB51318.1 type I-MYXAN CRISPR-associated protein Cas5/Cmx5/DevS [Corallococcus macrosporus DSM 14697]